ncbi:uncharacterized protein OCT59_003916 [Rhizophagus irregularis]|nr:hypothetical protein OCT59_003916 [Rhizophagus irregularis]
MSSQLPDDCLNEIFEYLENDTTTLHSCSLVNRLFCEIAIGILWKNVCNSYYKPYISLSIINTLITCLPKESKDHLHKNGICISTQKPPLFNYPSFCKTISIYKINYMIEYALRNQRLITSAGDLNHSELLLSHEILKMFINQISSLKSLDISPGYTDRIEFIYSPEAKICLKYLVELKCCSNICSAFFYQISEICHNIQSLTITFVKFIISDGIADLISLQSNLKSLTLEYCNKDIIRTITPSLAKSSLTITKLVLDTANSPLSFISTFINLQELILHLDPDDPNAEGAFEGFGQLQYIKFPQLRILEFNCFSPKLEMVIKFLEINGKNLTKFNSSYDDKTMNLVKAKFCPNLKSLCVTIKEDEGDELEALKLVLSSCQSLEIIAVHIDYISITSKNLFDVLAKYLPKNLHKLTIGLFISYKKLEGLEEFFINRNNCVPQKPLSLTIITDLFGDIYDSDLKIIIEKHSKMGVIKEYEFFSI